MVSVSYTHLDVYKRQAPETTLIEACAVALDVAGLEVLFVSAYHPPGHRAPPHEEWDALLDLSLIHI